jgi:hypothetical protein
VQRAVVGEGARVEDGGEHGEARQRPVRHSHRDGPVDLDDR